MTYQGSPKSVMKSSLHLYLQRTRRTFVQIYPWPAISASRFHSSKYKYGLEILNGFTNSSQMPLLQWWRHRSWTELDLQMIVVCTKLIQKRSDSRSWIRTYQICKWVAILTFGVLRETAGLQRHLFTLTAFNTLQTELLLLQHLINKKRVHLHHRLKMDIWYLVISF